MVLAIFWAENVSKDNRGYCLFDIEYYLRQSEAVSNKWFSESAEPQSSDGIDGDLWYDLAHNVIYVKQNGRWVEIMDFNNIVDERYTVEFDLNDTHENKASMPAGSLLSYEIECGKYFASSGYQLPIPTRFGFEFKGWYLVKNPSVVNGAFTDLTPVEGDLKLYAVWTEK